MSREGFPAPNFSWYASPSHESYLHLRDPFPLNFAKECSFKRKNSESKAGKGVFCTAGPCHSASPEQTVMNCIPAGQGWESLQRFSPPCHFSGKGRGTFGKDCVQLHILRVNSLPCSCCTGALSEKYRGHCFSPKPHHESVVAARKTFIFSAGKAVWVHSRLSPHPHTRGSQDSCLTLLCIHFFQGADSFLPADAVGDFLDPEQRFLRRSGDALWSPSV